MNFLAHLYLSENIPQITIGNFIADHVKGRMIERYSPGIQQGIRLHRAIDTYTDAHGVVRETVDTLREGYRKYAGVVVDMFFDHFLAADWELWSDEPLGQFAARMYRLLAGSYLILPSKTQYMLPFMMKNNLLLRYRDIEGLNYALNGMSRRTVAGSNLDTAAAELVRNYDYYHRQFNLFFPDLKKFTGEQMESILVKL